MLWMRCQKVADGIAVFRSRRQLIMVAHLQRRGSLAVTPVAGELPFCISQREWLPVHGVLGLRHPPLSSLQQTNNGDIAMHNAINMCNDSVCTSGSAMLVQTLNDIRCALLHEDRRTLRFAMMPDVSEHQCTIGPGLQCTFWDGGAAQVVKRRVGLERQGNWRKACSARQDQLHEMVGQRQSLFSLGHARCLPT